MVWDVLIAGLGPVGQLLANLLGAYGARVLAVDPAAGPSPLPRSATTDDEVLRILQGAGLDRAIAPHLAVQGRVAFVAADGRALTLLETGPGPNGHPLLAAWHQPGVEAVLCAGLERFPSVEARWGEALFSLDPDERDGTMRAGLRPAGGGATETVHARWVVGCDGARSPVRRLCGIPFGGSTYAQPWLVVDAEVDGPPPVAHVHFVGDPRRPAVTLPMAPGRHRWEFMTSAAEDHAALLAPEAIARRLEPWTRGTEVRVARAAVYEFHAREAARWRAGRVLLAGDAAHVMPPFAGQGLAAGARDAANLAWKLAAVLDGAPEALLDSYEAERRPDVRATTRVARAWGAVLQTRRPRLARMRDAALFALDPTPGGTWLRGRARPRAPLGRGAAVLRPGRRGSGTLFPQPAVRIDGQAVRLDDTLGAGWAVLGTPGVAGAEAWRAAGARVLAVPGDLGDPDDVIRGWLARHRATWVALRPDRVVFATGRADTAVPAARAAARLIGYGSR